MTAQRETVAPSLQLFFFLLLLSVLFYKTFLCNEVKKINNKAGKKTAGEVTQRFTAVLVIPRRLRGKEKKEMKVEEKK